MTARYYIFPDCIYYSARINDTTQAVFTGYEYFYEEESEGNRTVYDILIRSNASITSVIVTNMSAGRGGDIRSSTSSASAKHLLRHDVLRDRRSRL